MNLVFLSMNFLFLLLLNLLFLFDFNYFMVEWELVFYYSNYFGFTLIIDLISYYFLILLLFVSIIVMNYSYYYMFYDKFIDRFILLILMFIFSMILLIVMPNIISVLIGWDGLGLISFCLISFYQNSKSFNSSLITFLFNRLGDSFFYLMIYLLYQSGSLNFYFNMYNDCFFIFIIFIIGSITKSAQFPFFFWLPLAMVAPTPVSSLVHSSTLVVSGVYLSMRFDFSNYYFIFYLFYFTLFFSSLSAFYEIDLKKIIAYSTMSQLSFMFIMISMNMLIISFIHMIFHAVFKCMLFLCSGIIIHMYMSQDIRKMGLMFKLDNNLLIYFYCSIFSLCGFPFFSSFYSKDYFIEMLNMKLYLNYLLVILFIFSLMLTLLYSFRMCFLLNYYYNSFSLFNTTKSSYNLNYMFFFSIYLGNFFYWYNSFYLNYFPLNFFYKFIMYFVLVFMVFSYFKLNFLVELDYFLCLLNLNKLNIVIFNYLKFIEIGWFNFLNVNFMKNFNKSSYFYYSYHYNLIKFYLILLILLLLLL